MPPPPLRIAGASGPWGDRNDALHEQVRGGPVDFVRLDCLAEGPIARFELANLHALNFALHGALDTQGKTYGFALLRMEFEVPDGLDVPSLT